MLLVVVSMTVTCYMYVQTSGCYYHYTFIDIITAMIRMKINLYEQRNRGQEDNYADGSSQYDCDNDDNNG